MNAAKKLNITNSTITLIKRLTSAARQSREAEAELSCTIEAMPDAEKAELLALFHLGRRGSHCSFNVALKSASKQNPARISSTLTNNARIGDYLARGLKQHFHQS